MDGIEKLVVGAIVVCSNRVLLLTRAEGEFMGGLVELPSEGWRRVRALNKLCCVNWKGKRRLLPALS